MHLGQVRRMPVTGDHIGGLQRNKGLFPCFNPAACAGIFKYGQHAFVKCDIARNHHGPLRDPHLRVPWSVCRTQMQNFKRHTAEFIGVAVRKADVGGNNPCPFGLITIISLHAL